MPEHLLRQPGRQAVEAARISCGFSTWWIRLASPNRESARRGWAELAALFGTEWSAPARLSELRSAERRLNEETVKQIRGGAFDEVEADGGGAAPRRRAEVGDGGIAVGIAEAKRYLKWPR